MLELRKHKVVLVWLIANFYCFADKDLATRRKQALLVTQDVESITRSLIWWSVFLFSTPIFRGWAKKGFARKGEVSTWIVCVLRLYILFALKGVRRMIAVTKVFRNEIMFS